MRLEGDSNPGSINRENSTISYSDSKPDPIKDDLAKSHTTEAVDELPLEGVSIKKKKTAKIHDFCLGIPFGKSIVFYHAD